MRTVAEDTTGPYTLTVVTTTANNGTYTLTARARDAAGNITTSAPVTVTVANGVVDVTPPTVSLTAPPAGTVSGTVTLAATATDNVGVSGVQFLVDDAAQGAEDTSAPYSTSWNTTTATNGTHTLTVRARDAAGNITTSAPVTVTVANPVPGTTTSIFFGTSPRIGEADGTVLVPIVRTGDLTRPSTIEYGITADTATAGVDYVGGNGTITMDAGEDRVFIPVQILNDNLSEPTETFVVSIINVDSGSTHAFPANGAHQIYWMTKTL